MEDVDDWRRFGDAAGVHHVDGVGKTGDDTEVVSDEDDGQVT